MIGKRLMVHDMFRKARAAVPVERDDGQMVTLHFSQETAGTHQGQKETLGTWMPRRHVACASNDEQSYSSMMSFRVSGERDASLSSWRLFM